MLSFRETTPATPEKEVEKKEKEEAKSETPKKVENGDTPKENGTTEDKEEKAAENGDATGMCMSCCIQYTTIASYLCIQGDPKAPVQPFISQTDE